LIYFDITHVFGRLKLSHQSWEIPFANGVHWTVMGKVRGFAQWPEIKNQSVSIYDQRKVAGKGTRVLANNTWY
jgi:hypothetical protein